MEQIREYPFEFAKPLLLCFDLLNRCNIGFFDENIPFAVKYWRFGYMIPFIVIHYMSTTVYMIKIFTGPVNTYELAYMVPVYLIQMQCILKALIIVPKKHKIEHLITCIGTMWSVQNLTIIQINKKNNLLKRLNFSHIVFYWGSIIATYQHLMAPLVLTMYQKLVRNQNSGLQLPFGSVYPFDPVRNWFIYFVIYFLQAYSMLRVAYFYIGTEFLMITLSAHITTEFTLLREDLLKVAHEVVDKVNNYIAVLVLMFPIYVFCFYGDLLKEESAGIAASAYENFWYQRNTQYQKIISFIIMRSQRPCCLTSLEYTPITLNTFTKVVSTTWSYFSLAISVYSKG